jgi:hypothetical protein
MIQALGVLNPWALDIRGRRQNARVWEFKGAIASIDGNLDKG